MRVHILGICGTFMGGIALLARELGHAVSGSDANVYPPMSTMLEHNGIALCTGYEPAHLKPHPDVVIIGNALSRGNPAIEYTLDHNLPYTSGPQWLADYLLHDRHVLAVAGTHGKTTTTSILAWILEHADLKPGFIIGGVAENFGTSARLGQAPFFVVEADEYDTAFFDKRSKFIHYRPRTAILNNLEYDHADIFPDLSAIQTQFHHLVRTIPGGGLIIAPDDDVALAAVLKRGCWTRCESFGDSETAQWRVQSHIPDYTEFNVIHEGKNIGRVRWNLLGRHNARNALAAIAAACHIGVKPDVTIAALTQFKSVKRRLEKIAEIDGVSIYDDFAHHPTAIKLTLEALRARVGQARILAVLEPRSNTMKMGVHRSDLAPALAVADEVIILQPQNLGWDLLIATEALNGRRRIHGNVDQIVNDLADRARSGDHVLIMSNGDFGGLYKKLRDTLCRRGGV
ncbi:MAG TPA: UDP-N-acetylmuramate:L-alanyl-gamma-D-glutamyl-meso-diaminopimelate ligase [Gammaproteobacteria bacterium]|nr:UDP-N-acetylmuramate:L-alanyl-gamma-D-glutamyl-meso-diaminopimelate ligase [Gammaproteobacteria bacterium]